MKKQLTAAVAALCLCLSCFVVCAQKHATTSRVRIYLPQSDIKKLRTAGIEFDHGYYDFNEGYFENEFRSDVVEQIIRLGYKVKVTVDDVCRHTDSLNRVQDPYMYANDPVHVAKQFQNLRLNFTTTGNYEASVPTPNGFVLGSMGGFYNLSELNAQLDDIVNDFPGKAVKFTVGNTLNNVPIYGIKISDNASTDETNEAEILYTGLHHAREGMGMMNLVFYMRFLLENYSTNTAIKQLVDNREMFFIPVVNIDGFNYNTTATNWNAGRRMRRKNMQETTASAINSDGSGGDGVDINRNYPVWWGTSYSNSNTASSATGNSDAYRGPSANSEPETVAMMNYVNGRQFKMALNYHCYGNWWIRPEGPDPTMYPTTQLGAASVAIYNSIANLYTRYNCYVYGTANQTVYDVNGYSDDWFFAGSGHSPIYAFSPEIGNSSDGFWCPQAKIIPYAKELVFSNTQTAYTAGAYAELQDTSDIAVTSTTGNFGYTITRRGLCDSSIKVTLIPLNNIQSVGSVATISSIASFGGTVSGGVSYVLPASLATGSPIRFVWKLETGGITILDTVVKYYNPTIVFADNMETGVVTDRWVRTGTSSAWDYEAGTGVQATKSLTESSGGNYTNSADQSVRLATALDLSGATQAYLSFMMKYSSENCQDRLQLEVSTTGVTGTYNPVITDYTIVENRGSLGNTPAITGSSDGWVRELIDLRPYVGNNNVSFRFRFLSSAGTVVSYGTDGFQIDNVKVVKSGAFVLPLTFHNIVATRVNNAVLVQWKATTDASFSAYAVQRSADGIRFQTIGTLTAKDAAAFTDVLPLSGKNYYRVQILSTDGRTVNSNTAAVVFAEKALFRTYPNPVTNSLNVEVLSPITGWARIEVSSLDGQRLRTEKIVLMKGMNLYKLDDFYNAPQVFVVVVRDETGRIMHTERILKASHH